MSSSVVKDSEIEAILVELLGDAQYRQVFSGVSIDPERLPASLREVIKQHGNQMPITVQQKLKLLAGLVCHLKFPLDMCREVMIGSDCLDMPQVVRTFWVDWHAHPQRREFAVALFEAQPTRVILALVSAGFFNLTPTTMADLLETLTQLQTTFQVLREPLKASDPALLKLDELEDPFRKQAVLSFLTSLQQLSRVLVDPLDLPVLMGLGYLSSEQIAYTPLKYFQLSLAKHGIGQEHSTRIHNQANTVQLQVEQLWMTMLQGNRDLASPRVLFNKPGLLTTVGNAETLSRGLSPADNNLSAWFDDLDEVGCEDCCSVTSPAAYFVDLLRFLKNQPALPLPRSTDQKDIPAPVSAENSLLRKLLMRRPDLGDLLLSCRNTSELVPYIDLVNEALESAVVYLHGREDIGMGLQLRAYNADDSTVHAHDKATNSPASQDAANICFHVYDELISKKVHPAKIFPYDHSKDSLRQYLLTAGTDAVEVLKTFRSDVRLESIDPKFGSLAKDEMAVDMVHSRILAAETLGMAQADFVAITRESFYDIFTARLVEGDDKLSRSNYEKIAGLLPAWEYWGYEDKTIGEGDEEDTIFGEDLILDTKEGKGLPFIKTQLLPRLDQDFSTLFEILKTSFLGGCLTVSPLPSGQAFDPLKNMPSQLEGFRLRGVRGDPLDISSLQRLDQFNRLWRRLGWPIEDVDNALCILGDRIKPVDSADIPVITITANTVEQLAAVSDLCKVFNTSPRRVLALFSPSARLLTDLPISKAILASGKLPLGKTGAVEGEISASQYLPFILSSLDMSYDDYVHVQTVEKLGDHLTMHVLFRYYRMAETGRLMKVAVAEVTDLLEILARSKAETALTKPKAYLEMMLDWKRFQSGGLSATDLISVSKPPISQPPSISTLDCAAKMLSPALGIKQVLASTRVPPGAGSEPSIAQPHGNSSLHNVVQATFRAICPDIPAATLRTLLHFPDLPGLERGTTLYDYGIQISRETAVNPCSPEFQGGLFLTSDSAIHIEASWTSADVSPPILAYGGHEFKFSPTGAALKTGVRVECDVEGKKDDLIPLSWPKGLCDITMSFSYPDGDNISASASPPHVVGEESLINFQYAVDVLRRCALLLQRYPMQPEELEVVLPCALASSQDKGMTTRFFKSVRSYTAARKALSRPGQSKEFVKTLLWLREASLADEADSLVLVAKRLAQGTIMQQSTAEKILEGNFPKTGASIVQTKLQDFQILELIGKQVQLLKQTGLKEDSIELLFLLAQPPPFRCTTAQAEDRPEKQLAQLTRAALVNKGLRNKLESAQDKLRDNRRRALVQFLLQHPALKAQGVFDENSMFEYFLIDVQMGCGLDTTRIKQAISTVQLFIHRCLVGLEKNTGVDGTLIPQDRWAWMQKYTLWEANRKVFLYPENWVDPTLRDSKTQLFKSIEDAMTQTNLDDKAICKAIRSYVYGADDTANLRIEGCYWDRAPIKFDKSAGEQVTGEGSFHFFARTRNSPYHFYYRRLDYISRGTFPATSFTAWEKLPFDVRSHDIDHDGKSLAHPGAYIVPVVWRNRLVIFLPQLAVKTSKNTSENAHTSMSVTSQSKSGNAVQEMKVGSASANHVQLNMEIKMCWSEYIDGAWSPQKQSQDSIQVSGSTPDRPPEFDAFRFTARAGDDDQSVSVRVYQNTSPSGDLVKNTCLGEYSLRGPRLSFRSAAAMSVPARQGDAMLFKTRFGSIVRSGSEAEHNGSTLVQLTQLPKSLTSNLAVAAWPSLSKPPLDQSRKCTSVAWTMDSNETSNRQLGLVADICTRDGLGYEPWFTIPTKMAKSIGTVEDDGDVMLSVPFFNSLNDALRQSVTADDGVESIYHVMDKASLESDSGTKNNYAFGRFGFLSQCREDASPPAIYNWELGFHLVSLIVERLMSLQEFDRAIKYAQLVFDPTGTNEPPKEKSQAWRPTWRFPPFRDPATLTCGTLDSIIDGLDPSSGSEITMTHSIRTWRQKPFQPHAVARGRPLAYMKRIVIKYIEALIASGDAYFRQNSLESVPLAIQRYVEAAHIFGPTAPQSLPALGTNRFKSYNDIGKQIDDFSNASVELQLSFPYFIPLKERGLSKTDPSALQSFPRSRYFGVQANQSFLDLRKLVEDRLFKIRNSLDINGNPRTLSLWDPPLDVGNLVNAAAVGTPTDMGLIASGFSPILPRTRFTYLMQKAFELCGELKQINSSLLSAIEKKDAEALQLMRANQETGMQRILKEMKLMQKLEAEKGLEQLDESRKAAMHRLEFYAALTGDKVDVPDIGQDFQTVEQNIPKPTDEDLRLTRHELLELRLADESSMYNSLASSEDAWAAILLAVPMPSLNAQPMGVGISEQLPNFAQAFQAEAASLRADALRASEDAQRAARISQWTRQLQERRLQLNMAGLEIQNINKQIEIHKARIAAIEKDILAQDQTAQNAADVQKFLSTKFTNEELYNWLENSARSYLYQVYLVAMEIARKVETAYNFEQGGQRRPVLASTGYWDQGKRGLECGNQLWFALKQMELAYLGEKRHDFELTKNVSLRQLSPASLISLRELGDATFEIPELLFDMDFPGHYFRRIKSVSISIHCITGPYTSINCTATLIDHCYRWNPVAAGGDYAEKTGGRGDSRFMGNQVQTPITSIAMSSGQQDAGVFELNFNGETYQPFEGAGAISKWRLRLPNKFRQFDYRSISDVVLQVRYTAKDGGQGLCEAAAQHVEQQLKNISKSTSTGLLLDVRNDCPDAWFALTRAGSQQMSAMPMANIRDRLPYFTRGQNIKVKTVTAYVRSPTVGNGTEPEDIMSSLELYVAKSQDAQAAAAPGGAVKLAYAEKLGEHNLHVFQQVVTSSGGGGNLQAMLQTDSPWYLILSGDKTATVVQDIMLLVDYILE